MKVSDFKEALGAQNLAMNCVKEILIIRLKKAVDNGMAVVYKIDPNTTSNVVGQNLELMAQWELLTPDT